MEDIGMAVQAALGLARGAGGVENLGQSVWRRSAMFVAAGRSLRRLGQLGSLGDCALPG